MCITVKKKFKKVEKWKNKLALKFLKKSGKSRKIPKITFYKMGDFWHFFAICILYLHFVFCILYFCLFVFLSFCLFSILFADARSGSPSPSERLTSNSRVASDHRNRHNHHQMSIRTQKRPKMSLGVLHANTRHKYANTQIRRRSIEHADAVWHF